MKICSSCRVGRLRQRSMAYVEWYGKNLLVVDRMPVQICDICGERAYDNDAMESLQRLLWANMPDSIKAIPNRNT